MSRSPRSRRAMTLYRFIFLSPGGMSRDEARAYQATSRASAA